eukprot:4046610-Heterocapsa_arctica.AAC.1
MATSTSTASSTHPRCTGEGAAGLPIRRSSRDGVTTTSTAATTTSPAGSSHPRGTGERAAGLSIRR